MSLKNPIRLAFWDHVDTSGNCWPWRRAISSNGYGHVLGDNGRQQSAHTLAYEAYYGPVANGMEIDHLCRNRMCCNPFHLEAVTHRENVLRGTSLSALRAKQTHCARGHELEFNHSYSEPRRCRLCVQIKNRRRYEE